MLTKRFLFVLLLVSTVLGSSLWAQATLTNADIPKLVQSGLSEDFILNLIDQQGSKLLSDAPHLADLKRAGVSESIIWAVAKKNPPIEPYTSDGVVLLVKAGFTEGFVAGLVKRYPSKFALDAGRIVELRQAGVGEEILAIMVAHGASRDLPSGTEISIRLIDSIDSERNNEGDEFRASLEEPVMVDGMIVAPKGADAQVKLVSEQESGKLTGRAQLSVQLLWFSVNGRMIPVRSTQVTEGSSSRGARTAKSAAAVGAVGAIIGAIAGGGSGAAIGAGAGAAAGAGSQVFMKGQRVRIPSETVLTFTTLQTIKLP